MNTVSVLIGSGTVETVQVTNRKSDESADELDTENDSEHLWVPTAMDMVLLLSRVWQHLEANS